MKHFNPWSFPAARSKRRLELAVQFFVLLLLAVCVAAGTWLWGYAYPIVAAVAGLMAARSAYGTVSSVVRRHMLRGEEVTARAQLPAVWDALTLCAERAGIPRPRLFLFSGFRYSYAMSWEWGGVGYVGVSTHIVRHFSHDMLAATVGHEVAHLRNRDSAFARRTRMLADALLWNVVCLFVFGLSAIVLNTPLAMKSNGVACCIVAMLSLIALNAVARRSTPWLTYWAEYAADAHGAVFCGNPKALVKVMLFASVDMVDFDTDPLPNKRRASPPPLARANALIIAFPEALSALKEFRN